ncbi:hypothetical protein PAXINDRAFT_96719 [Paxillus involutus ATCC 200175]|nr:hypothetical protein PAXINDRAFT_96719 [Paxillus involutus ATCC 200175]
MDPVEPPIRTTGNPGPERTVEPQGQGQQYRGRAEQRPERPAPPTQPLDITPRPTSRYLPNPSDRGDAPQVGGSPETQRTGSPSEQTSTRQLIPAEMKPTNNPFGDHDRVIAQGSR